MREREFSEPARMPEDIFEQLEDLPGFSERENVCRALKKGLTILLSSHGVEIVESTSRPKTRVRMEDKIKRRNSIRPARDIYGIRFIIEDENRGWIKDLLQSAYPATPEIFAGGKPSAREYRDPYVRDYFRERFNPHLGRLYSAMHVNIVFLREGRGTYDIAEVQILTSREHEVNLTTRDNYANGNGKTL